MTPWTSPVSFLMCTPSFFGVNYQINPWMAGNEGQVDRTLAIKQWELFKLELSRFADCFVIPGEPNWPDLVFTANAALISPFKNSRKAILTRFKHPQRQGEEPIFEEWLTQKGFDVIKLPLDCSFEGAGDALFDTTGTLWAAVGPRTDARAHDFIQSQLGCGVQTVRLVNPAFYHLDTCFCPLGNGHCIVYPGAFDQESIEKLRFTFSDRLIEITHEEAHLFCANAVEACGVILMSECTPRLEQVLNHLGYRVITSPLSEFLKAGGSAKCLTLALHGQSFSR